MLRPPSEWLRWRRMMPCVRQSGRPRPAAITRVPVGETPHRRTSGRTRDGSRLPRLIQLHLIQGHDGSTRGAAIARSAGSGRFRRRHHDVDMLRGAGRRDRACQRGRDELHGHDGIEECRQNHHRSARRGPPRAHPARQPGAAQLRRVDASARTPHRDRGRRSGRSGQLGPTSNGDTGMLDGWSPSTGRRDARNGTGEPDGEFVRSALAGTRVTPYFAEAVKATPDRRRSRHEHRLLRMAPRSSPMADLTVVELTAEATHPLRLAAPRGDTPTSRSSTTTMRWYIHLGVRDGDAVVAIFTWICWLHHERAVQLEAWRWCRSAGPWRGDPPLESGTTRIGCMLLVGLADTVLLFHLLRRFRHRG